MSDPKPKTFLFAILLTWATLLVISHLPFSSYFRPWEVLVEGPYFFKARSSVKAEAYGDLAQAATIHQVKEPRSVTFTTDVAGFRNLPGEGPYPVVVIGDSFVVGAGLDDRQTIPYQLSQQLSSPVYNYGLQGSTGAPYAFLNDARFIHNKPKLVIYAPASREVRPPFLGRWGEGDEQKPGDPAQHQSQQVLSLNQFIPKPLVEGGRLIENKVVQLNQENALRRGTKWIFNSAFFGLTGSPYSKQFTAIKIENKKALVLPIHRQNLHLTAEQRQVEKTARHLKTLSEICGKRNIRFVFCPLPETGLIYPDHFSEKERAAITQPRYWDALFQALQQENVTYINLLPALIKQREPYLFYRDDTHYNARATALIAELIYKEIQEQSLLVDDSEKAEEDEVKNP